MKPLIKVSQIIKSFKEGEQNIQALYDISLEIEPGEFTALCGPSGSGKTTLLNLIGCLDKPTSGTIEIDGTDITALDQRQLTDFRRSKIGFIFQDFNLIPTLTVAENVEYGLWLMGVSEGERRSKCREVLETFEVSHLIDRRPSKLSRGQQQRVAVARAIVHRPKIILGDELTANLDQKTGVMLIDFLKSLNRSDKITFVYATHDPVMMQKAERIIRIKDGKLVESKPDEPYSAQPNQAHVHD